MFGPRRSKRFEHLSTVSRVVEKVKRNPQTGNLRWNIRFLPVP